jgi:hypothetical protein
MRRKLFRKTTAGMITNEITKTLKTIVQFSPIKFSVKEDLVLFQQILYLKERKMQTKIQKNN